ncbi:hypothetical protein ASPZODRAFT_135050 [Penicilliopsis zonata CBS 506.65]|uniref:RNA-binding protein n=1 Tax=Penicilliopsis zonata CBS 506.65 TaxID=1073090 RepID=A0A1L9SAU1_9EURO|nr:hypothetical protein ASPZODRAFT_135050 [Penicilliopsis zonata CBS 506.65]OJJ44256.1 hypothetical protein ASPZODRAFT_135050 [Penicilliopsis zonata CBS 506.65]
MAHFNSTDPRYPPGPPGPPHRQFPRRDDRDGRMYDDRSRSRSRSANRRLDSHDEDRTRSPPRGPAVERSGEYSRDRDYRRHSSRSPHPPPSRRGRPSYRDRDREGYRSPPYRSRSHSRSYSRSRSPRRGRHFGQESREIMMDGLPADMGEEDVLSELKEFYHIEGLEEVRVIRDRQTKVSRGLGFLQFRSVNECRPFLERNYPFIQLHGRNSERGTKVRIAYSREREDRNRGKADGDWTCPNCAIMNYSTRFRCFRCQAPRPDPALLPPPDDPPPKVVNNGDNDAAPENQASQFLLFRGLESSVTEELLAKGVAKLYRPATDGASTSQKKGAKVASTTGDSNLGARDGSIRRVLLVRDRETEESWRYGFAEFATVQDAQAAVARLNSFDKFTISSKQVLVSYIHAGVFVPVLKPTAATERFSFSPLANPSLRLMYWDEEAYVTELVLSTADIEGGQGSTKGERTDSQPKSVKEIDKAKKRKADAAGGSGAKKIAVPSHLQFWSNRHAELHGISKKDGVDKTAASAPFGSESAGSPPESNAPPTKSYGDPNRYCCYLCMRQFNSSAEVNRHERLSQLHRDNLQNEEAKAKAEAKLVKHGITPQSTTEYRDRARERRQAFGSTKSSKSKASAPAPAPKEDEAPVQTTSKGASLLSKMGWSAGSGLGAQGTGVTAPIATEVYAQGVGLGAQGSKLGDATEEANRNTRNRYEEFLEKTRRQARERYEQME